jgi:Tol biopolymer transport system component
MPTRDDELTRKLKSAARPVAEPDFHTMVQMKSRHDRRRRIERGVLAVGVLAGLGLVVFALSRSGQADIAPETSHPTPSSAGAARNGAIVFVAGRPYGNSQLWTADPGGFKTELTSGHDDRDPAVSPDGSLVLFSRGFPQLDGMFGRQSLYTIPIHGGTPSLLLDGWFATDPAWSPDGRWIAFAGGGQSRATGIYVMRADGSVKPRLVYAGKTDLSQEGHPSWSPDGKELAFQEGNAALLAPNFELYVVPIDGSKPAVDITYALGTACSAVGPAWSPDGSRIAFSLQPTGGNGGDSCRTMEGIASVAPDGSDMRSITEGRNSDVDPTWSPDGTLIAFARGSHGSLGIYTIPSSGGPGAVIREVTPEGADPAWQSIVPGARGS